MTLNRRAIWTLLFVTVVTIGMGGPAMAVSAPDRGSILSGSQVTQQQTPNGTTSGVNVTVGPQLATVISVSSDDVQTGFQNTAFELTIERDDDGRAEAFEDRAEELRERAEDIREDYEEAAEEYEEGDLTKSEFAQRLAVLNARATNLLESYEQFRQRVNKTNASANGEINQSDLNEAIENLDIVSGAGADAILRQFTGETQGKIEIETSNGLEIEVESEDGEFSREFERQGDDDESITVNQSEALETARSALSTPANGTWELTELEIDEDDGVYEFEFELRGADDLDGEAEVELDGSSGGVVSLEEEIESRDDDDADESDDDDLENDDDEEDDDDEDGDDDDEDDDDDDEDDDD